MGSFNKILVANRGEIAIRIFRAAMCAPLFCPDTLQKTLSLPIDWEPQSLVTLGYPVDKGKPFQRRGTPELTRIIDA